MKLISFILAGYSRYREPNPYDEWLKEHIGLLIFIGLILFVGWIVVKVVKGSHCAWCKKRIEIFSPHKTTLFGYTFCCLQVCD